MSSTTVGPENSLEHLENGQLMNSTTSVYKTLIKKHL